MARAAVRPSSSGHYVWIQLPDEANIMCFDVPGRDIPTLLTRGGRVLINGRVASFGDPERPFRNWAAKGQHAMPAGVQLLLVPPEIEPAQKTGWLMMFMDGAKTGLAAAAAVIVAATWHMAR